MRNGFFVAISLAWFGAALVHGQEVPPPESAVVPGGTLVPTPVWTTPLPDGVAPATPMVDETPANNGGAGSHFYLSADYLLWQTSKFPISAPLVTTGTTSGLGALNQPGTNVLFGGDQRVSVGSPSGVRIMGGGWLTQDGWLRGELGGFILSPQGVAYSAASNGPSGTGVLAEPFVNSNNGNQSVLVVGAPGTAVGSVWVGASSQLRGAEANVLHDFVRTQSTQASLLLGIRYVNLSENLNILDSIVPLTPVMFGNSTASPGDIIRVGDNFTAHNNFLGPQIGSRLRYQLGILSADFSAKLGLGTDRTTVTANGASSLTSATAGNQVLPGGFYALTSNSSGGGGASSRFCFVPELGANFGIQVLPSVFVRAGYTFLYMTSVTRVGQQINNHIDVTQVPAGQFFGQPGGNGQPMFNTLTHGTYYAQGLNVGLEIRY